MNVEEVVMLTRAELGRITYRLAELERRDSMRTGNMLDQTHAELSDRLVAAERVVEAAREAEAALRDALQSYPSKEEE